MRSAITRCSLVVRLIDGLTGEAPIAGSVRLSLIEQPQKPIMKSNGCFVFIDLQVPSVSVAVQSPYYLEATTFVDIAQLEALHPLITIVVMPSRSYPLTAGTTALTGMLQDSRGLAAAGVTIRAQLTDDRSARGRLGQDLAPGTAELEVLQLTGKLRPGDRLRIRDRARSADTECVIGEVRGSGKGYLLQAPIHNACSRGSLIFPVIETLTGTDGSFVVPFRPIMPSQFPVRLTIGPESKPYDVQALHMVSGEVHHLPPIRLQVIPT